MTKVLRLLAPAKLNLGLEVLGKRDDGYHEIRSVAQQIGIYDRLEVEECDELCLDAPELTDAVEDNLVMRAAQLLQARHRQSKGARIRLWKEIAVAAGLGGGSSDAAATLRLLNRLWDARLSRADLERIGSELGSDVPLFLRAGASVLSGRGEQALPLPAVSGAYLVLVVPPWDLPNKTVRVYQALQADEYTSGGRVAHLAELLRSSQPLRSEMLFNGLAPAALRVFPELSELWRAIEQRSGARFILAGAGPALFHLANDWNEAKQVARQAAEEGIATAVARSRTTLPRIVCAEPLRQISRTGDA